MEFRIKEARQRAGIAQKDMAKKLGIAAATLSGYESGAHDPKSELLSVIADTCGVSVDFLLGRDTPEDEKSPGLSTEAMQVARDYDGLAKPGQRLVRVVIDELKKEATPDSIVELKPATRIIRLLGSSFAAGTGEPDFGNAWTDYEVPADSPAEFAIRINGDSMEPYLPDGSIALCRIENPRDGDVAALLIDGEFLCKQVCIDLAGTLHLFSLNRDRRDMDRHIPRDDIDRQIKCFGTVIMKDRIPLPLDA